MNNVHTWLHAALALISKQVHLLTTTHAVNTVQVKVNGTDPYMAMVYIHIGLLQFCLFMPHWSVEYGLRCACQRNRILYTRSAYKKISCIVRFAY